MVNGYPTMTYGRSNIEEFFGGKLGAVDAGFAAYTVLVPIFLGPIAIFISLVDFAGYFIAKKKKYKVWFLIAGIVHAIAGLASIVTTRLHSKGYVGLYGSQLPGFEKLFSINTWATGKFQSWFTGVKVPTVSSLAQLTAVSGIGITGYGF